jgi:hypothetical protein
MVPRHAAHAQGQDVPLGVVHRRSLALAVHLASGHGAEDSIRGEEFQDVVAGEEGEDEATVRPEEQ